MELAGFSVCGWSWQIEGSEVDGGVESSPVQYGRYASGQVRASREVGLSYGTVSVVVEEVPRWVRSYNDGPIKKGLSEV